MRKAKRGKEERRQWDEEGRGEEWSGDNRSGAERREERAGRLDVMFWRGDGDRKSVV